MKRHIIRFSCAISFFILAAPVGFSQKLRVYLDTKQFCSPAGDNYMELYFQFVGYSLNYKGVAGGLQSELAVSLRISREDSLVRTDAYRLTSPVMKDSIIDDFFDLRRYSLNPGAYQLQLSLVDMNGDQTPVQAKMTIQVEDYTRGIQVSDIEPIEYAFPDSSQGIFNKSGFTILPRLSTFYPSELSSIPCYFEVYQTNQLNDSVFGLKQSIVSVETNEELESYTRYSKHLGSEVIPFIRNVDIADVPSGKYALTYTLISKGMAELAVKSYYFERSNDREIAFDFANMVIDPAFQSSILDDSVTYFLESLIPISKPAEIKNIIAVIKENNLEQQRKHIQAFWSKTSPINPYASWLNYKGQVLLVEKLYSNNFQEGFETDRGRVYLQYGAPTNIIQREVSSTEYPYEIWQYNKIGQFSNRRFIFYNPDLVNNTYRLLHSDMLGELKNPGWPQILSTRNTNKGNIDNPNQNVQQTFGGTSEDFFRQY
jgi:GWxTD domain-containing protein